MSEEALFTFATRGAINTGSSLIYGCSTSPTRVMGKFESRRRCCEHPLRFLPCSSAQQHILEVYHPLIKILQNSDASGIHLVLDIVAISLCLRVEKLLRQRPSHSVHDAEVHHVRSAFVLMLIGIVCRQTKDRFYY